ncbi:MAG: iron-sulfur cluster assembly accessory protein [Dehalococcoidia bacterium]|jgi:iron-sulfur cluster assembly accessory protein|nr:iron-sulfur cluster assembly accessory protein [Dehalococcoidia bacterium]
MATEIFNEKNATQTLVTPVPTAPLVTITPKAAEKAKALLVEKGEPDAALRVFVVGGGCSGYQYGMAIADSSDAGDALIEQHDVRIVVDPDSQGLIGGAEIDYIEDLMKSGFTIHNPTAVSSCACGNSFQTADGSGAPRACI